MNPEKRAELDKEADEFFEKHNASGKDAMDDFKLGVDFIDKPVAKIDSGVHKIDSGVRKISQSIHGVFNKD